MAGSKRDKGADLGQLKTIEPEAVDAKEETKSAKDEVKDEVKDKPSADPSAGNADASDSKEPAKDSSKTSDSAKPSEGAPLGDSKSAATDSDTPRPPPRPERRKSAFTSNLGELTAAFPDSPVDVCRGMLVASSNNLESAFSGMLAIADETIRPAAYVKEQIEHDEQLARRLAMSDQQRRRRRSEQRPSRHLDYDYAEQSPDSASGEVYEGLQRGLNDTKQVVSTLWGNLKSRINGEIYDDDDDIYSAPSNREPLRSQWFPREPSGSVSSTPRSNQPMPKLPPRKPSRPSVTSENPANTDSPVPRAEPKSVNAFGDSTLKNSDKPDEQEPDAFFIGESDDDLGSLNEEDVGPHDTSKNEEPSTPKHEEPSESATDGASKEASSGSAGGSDKKKQGQAEEDKKKEELKTAKDLLSKFKTDADKSK